MKSRAVIWRSSRLLGGAWLLGLLLLGGGCAVYLPAGPDPAHLVVKAQAAVTPEMVEDTMQRRARLVFNRALGGGEEVSQPLWDLRAFVPQPDGSLTPLQPVRAVENQSGYDLRASAEFLAPPGTYQVLFLLECSVRHLSLEYPTVVEYIYLLTWRQQQTLEFCPGCRLELTPFQNFPLKR